jgi:hypothetical protein
VATRLGSHEPARARGRSGALAPARFGVGAVCRRRVGEELFDESAETVVPVPRPMSESTGRRPRRARRTVSRIGGQVGRGPGQPLRDQTQPARFGADVEQRLGHGQGEQLGVGQPRAASGTAARAKIVADPDLECGREGAEVGRHNPSLNTLRLRRQRPRPCRPLGLARLVRRTEPSTGRCDDQTRLWCAALPTPARSSTPCGRPAARGPARRRRHESPCHLAGRGRRLRSVAGAHAAARCSRIPSAPRPSSTPRCGRSARSDRVQVARTTTARQKSDQDQIATSPGPGGSPPERRSGTSETRIAALAPCHRAATGAYQRVPGDLD